MVVCLASLAATLTLPPTGSNYSPHRPAPERMPPVWMQRPTPTRKPSLPETPREGHQQQQQYQGVKKGLAVGVVLPHSSFHGRRYNKAINEARLNMQRDPALMRTFRHYHFNDVILAKMQPSSSPTSEYKIQFFFTAISPPIHQSEWPKGATER